VICTLWAMTALASLPRPRVVNVRVKSQPVAGLSSPLLPIVQRAAEMQRVVMSAHLEILNTHMQSPLTQTLGQVHLQLVKNNSLFRAHTQWPTGHVFGQMYVQSPALKVVQRPEPTLGLYLQAELKGIMSSVQSLARATALDVLAQNHLGTLSKISAISAAFHLPADPELYRAETAVRGQLPQTREQLVQVEQAAVRALTDPARLSMIQRMTSGITRRDLVELENYGLLVLAAWLLFHLALLPNGMKAVEVIGVIAATAAILQNRRSGE